MSDRTKCTQCTQCTQHAQRVKNLKSTLPSFLSRGIMVQIQIDEARRNINEGCTRIEVVIADKKYGIHGLSQMLARGYIIGVEDDEFDEYRFSTLDSFIKWLKLKLLE